jgi:2-C-methyl-D-erythritol 2,4-cyclodiphosphate synthase
LKIKIGLGYDIHRLSKGKTLYLGGVKIPHHSGLVGHSDGDCLIHALVDALLGALGEGDIGQIFPDSDPKWAGIRSVVLLRKIIPRLKRKKAEILNIDLVVVAQTPKLAPHVIRMKKELASTLGIPAGDIGIKAKTNEGLGLVGQERAIACWAVVMVGLPSPSGGK